MGKLSSSARGFGSAIAAPFGPSKVDRAAQIYAALLLPFFVLFSIVLAKAANTIFLSFMPESVAAIAALRVVLGFLLVVATGMSWIVWVRTGGFSLFA